jgi:hypothetical protein
MIVATRNTFEGACLMKCQSFAILIVAFCIAGCGASNVSPSSPTPIRTGITNNWQLALSDSPGIVGATYGIYLTQKGNAVSGILAFQQVYQMCVPPSGPPCAFPFGEIPLELTGTVDTSGNIVLNSVPDSGGPAAFSITASTTDDTTLSGTYTITLVTTSPPATWVDQGTISGNTINALNGTYSGTVKSPTGLSMDVTTTLSQTSSPNSFGDLEVSASANFVGLQCFTSATVPNPGGLRGNQLVVNFIPSNSPSTTISMFGTLSPDAKTIAVSFTELSGGACSSGYYYGELGNGTLTLQ